MLMKKLSEEHYVMVDDSEIKQGDWYYLPRTHSVYQCKEDATELNLERDFGVSKVTHSTQPLEWFGGEIIFLSEVKELLGVVDVETKAHNWSTRQTTRSTDYWRSMVSTYVEAYNECLEDNKEKKYTETDIKNAIIRAYSMMGNTIDVGYFNEVIQSLQPQTEWEVEFIDGKLQLVKE